MPRKKKEPPDERTRFEQLARALFRVDKREIPTHEPKKRIIRDQPTPIEEP